MVTISKARKILKNEAKNLSDEQIKELLGQFYCLAEVAAQSLQKNPKWIKTLKE